MTVAVVLTLSLFGGSVVDPDRIARAQEGTAIDDLPVIFTVDDSGLLTGYNVDGEFIDDETFEAAFDVDAADLEGVAVDYVTQSGGSDVFGASVVAADADTGGLYVGIGVINSSPPPGFTDFGVGFGEDDRLLTANLSRNNDPWDTKLLPDRSHNEILIVRDGGTIDVHQYDDGVSGFPVVKIDTLDLGFGSADHVAVGDIGNIDFGLSVPDDFDRFGREGLAEIIVADPATGAAQLFDHTGEPIDVDSFDIGFDSGDRITTGNVNGVGGEDILVADPDTGTVDIFDFDFESDEGLHADLLTSISVGFGDADQIDLADVNGNGIEEILIANAATGNADVYRYDLAEQTIFSEPSLNIGYSDEDLFNVMPVRYPDVDGDGLFDHWETHGVDVDGDGSIDIDLPSLGADPDHKDIFVEYDYVSGSEPSRAAVQRVKDAFAAAPVVTGGVRNPDREPGINLWIDTGGLTEAGQPVGDDLGGGNEIPASDVPPDGICGIEPDEGSADFQDIKADPDNFDPLRTHVFRYALSVESPTGCDKGGQAEISGNDFVEHADSDDSDTTTIDEAAIIMHELGHTLGLFHGGFIDVNCKPNYISVMNYGYGTGIIQEGGGRIIDYSPVRSGGDRAAAPLPDLVEKKLVETEPLDPTDSTSMVTFSNEDGDPVRTLGNSDINWNANFDENGQPIIDEGEVEANIDNLNYIDDCTNDFLRGEDRPFRGHDDWRNLLFPVRNNDASAAGVVVPPDFDEPTMDDLTQLREGLHTTDLAIDITTDVDPAVAGTEIGYAITVDNLGPNPADAPEVIVELPDGFSFQDSDATCAVAAGQVECSLDQIFAGESTEFTLTALVSPDLVYTADGPTSVTTDATVENSVDVASDPEAGNDIDQVETDIVAESDLEAVTFEAPDDPIAVLIDTPTAVELDKAITNRGPSGPVDVALSIDAEPNDALEISLSDPTGITALDVDEERAFVETIEVLCHEPGVHTVPVTNSVEPTGAATSDPDTSNNQTTTDLTIQCVVPVAINIKPGSSTNPINLNGNQKAPVAVLSTAAGEYGLPRAFDATSIDATSAVFGPASALFGVEEPAGSPEVHGRGHVEDALELDESTLDGDEDMVLHFSVPASGLESGDAEACVTGEFTTDTGDTRTFFGCDSITTKP